MALRRNTQLFFQAFLFRMIMAAFQQKLSERYYRILKPETNMIWLVSMQVTDTRPVHLQAKSWKIRFIKTDLIICQKIHCEILSLKKFSIK